MTHKDKTPSPPNRLVCDFTSGSVRHRFLYGGGRGQALPKVVGIKCGKNPSVVDATAGLGRDAFLLASLGATVTLIERVPEIQRLLHDA
ncbi:MAG: class I SAM-dependent methyltransferase, partial [Rhodospirillaceae bacterium]|nr:class I SAM-dependent methyltransferase [Rhodospirillaceae bacterium]